MKAYKNFVTADFYVQTFLIGIPLFITLIGLLVGEYGGIILSMFALILIGGWQLISGLIMSIGFKDPLRQKYLVGALLYLGIAFLITQMANWAATFRGLETVIWFFIPIGIAIWYYAITYLDHRKAKESKQTFWDLE